MDEVLANRKTLNEKEAYVVGYISDIKGDNCYIVSDLNDINDKECKIGESLSPSSFKEFEELTSSGYFNEKAIMLCVMDKESAGLFKSYQVGDFIRVKAHLYSGNNGVIYYSLNILDEKNVSLYQ